MPRPPIRRRIRGNFSYEYYKPQGVPLRFLEEVCLAEDELEALRLADLEGQYQADAAQEMGVSRQTFGNIIKGAHQKIANALINGQAIRIEIGDNPDPADKGNSPEEARFMPGNRGGRGRGGRFRGGQE